MLAWIRTSTWAFPVAVLLLVLLLSSLRLHGSSVGVYHTFLYGNSSSDSSLIVGNPRIVRSDEWVVNSQLTIAQREAGYPRVNQNLGSGRDMSVLIDVPYKEWSALFKPQNLAYFVAPFEFAFAFKWWFLLGSLAISCYFFTLKATRRKTLSIVLALAFSFSPFVFWWYQTTTLMPLAYGFLICVFCMRLIDKSSYALIKNPRLSTIVDTLILSYLLAAFGLALYPPFQIPIAFAVACFIAGYFIHKFRGTLTLRACRPLLPILLGVLSAGAIVAVFFLTRRAAFEAISNTVYPGQRTVLSGGFNPYLLVSGIFQAPLQFSSRAQFYPMNQSEASNFIFLLPFIFVPCLVYLLADFRQKNIDWRFAGSFLGIMAIMAWLFIPKIGLLFRPFLFNIVPHERMLIGLGFLSFVLLVLFIQRQGRDKTKIWSRYTGLFVTAAALPVLYGYVRTAMLWPAFAKPGILFASLAVLIFACVILLLLRKSLLFAVFLAVFSFSSVALIHPLYRGLGPYNESAITEKIRTISGDDDTWAILGNHTFENLALISGQRSFTGIFAYPDTAFWQNVLGPENEQVYNRYAHVALANTTPSNTAASLRAADAFSVRFSCEQPLLNQIDYIVAVDEPMEAPCVQYIDEVVYPAVQFKIYKISK